VTAGSGEANAETEGIGRLGENAYIAGFLIISV